MGELQNELKEIKELLQEKEKSKPKKFKLPFSSKVNKSKAKKNWVTIQRINENGHVDFKKVQISEQTFMEEGIPRLASAGYVNYYKKNPLIILPSWSVEPFSPQKHFQESLKDGSNVNGYRLLMNRMKNETINPKKGFPGIMKWVLGLILAGIIIYALMTGSG